MLVLLLMSGSKTWINLVVNFVDLINFWKWQNQD